MGNTEKHNMKDYIITILKADRRYREGKRVLNKYNYFCTPPTMAEEITYLRHYLYKAADGYTIELKERGNTPWGK